MLFITMYELEYSVRFNFSFLLLFCISDTLEITDRSTQYKRRLNNNVAAAIERENPQHVQHAKTTKADSKTNFQWSQVQKT